MAQGQDQYAALAKRTLEEYITTGKIIDIPDDLPEEMISKRAGVFVSLKMNGELRGCIGTIKATRSCIAEEIIQNAISAGIQDPRFYPVQQKELEDIVYSVDILMDAEPIQSIEQLDVKKYGIIVRSGSRTGLLLPNLEGVDTPEYQIGIALHKAGIGQKEDFTMERFEVIRHGEK